MTKEELIEKENEILREIAETDKKIEELEKIKNIYINVNKLELVFLEDKEWIIKWKKRFELLFDELDKEIGKILKEETLS